MNQELQHNTHEQTVSYLCEALAAVREAEIPEHLEVAAFTKALDLCAAKQIFVQQPPPPALGIPMMGLPQGRNHKR